MSCTFKKTTKRTLFGTVAAIVVALAFTMVGCGGNDSSSGSSDPDPFVTGNNQAWISTNISVDPSVLWGITGEGVFIDVAFTLNSNGTGMGYVGIFGEWMDEMQVPITWEVKGNEIFVTSPDGEVLGAAYSWSGSDLVITELESGTIATFTKKPWPQPAS